MSCGTPVISADCPSGPSEVIRDGLDAVPVPTDDFDALAKAMTMLMAEVELREHLGKAATLIRHRLDVAHGMNLWEEPLA